MKHTWEANLENKKKLTIEDAKYIFEQAEKFLTDISESHKSVVERTHTLLAIFITILSALIGFNIDRLESNNLENDNITNSIWVMMAYLIIGTISLIRNIRPTDYMGIGSPPINIFVDKFFLDIIPKNERIIRMYISEIEKYQFRIQTNTTINDKKWSIFTLGIYWILAIPIVFLICYISILIFT